LQLRTCDRPRAPTATLSFGAILLGSLAPVKLHLRCSGRRRGRGRVRETSPMPTPLSSAPKSRLHVGQHEAVAFLGMRFRSASTLSTMVRLEPSALKVEVFVEAAMSGGNLPI